MGAQLGSRSALTRCTSAMPATVVKARSRAAALNARRGAQGRGSGVVIGFSARWVSLRVSGLVLDLGQEGVQAAEAGVPALPELFGPLGHVTQGLRLQPAGTTLSQPGLADQSGAAEDPQVFGDRRLADRERRRQLGHGRIAV